MKKLLALMLAAALALSLVACGGGGGTGDTNISSSGNDASPEVSEPQEGTVSSEEPQEIILGLNETTTIGGVLELFTDSIMFSEKRVLDSNSVVTPPNGYLCATFYFIAKNVGKSPIQVSSLNSYIEYGDGYTFPGEPGVVGLELAPLTEEEILSIYYYVPPEAFENKDNPLSIVLIYGDEQYGIPLRAQEGEQLDKIYKSIDSMIADGWYTSAIWLIEVSGAYQRYSVVTGDEIKEFVLSGPVNMMNNMSLGDHDRKTYRNVSFREDGIYDSDGASFSTPWRIDGDAFIFQWGFEHNDYACEVRKLSDNAYLLVWEGNPVRILWRDNS